MKPTKTETLLFGPDGAADPRSPFFLERHLIPTVAGAICRNADQAAGGHRSAREGPLVRRL